MVHWEMTSATGRFALKKTAMNAIEAVREAWTTRSTPLKGALIVVGVLWVVMVLSTHSLVGGTAVTVVCCGLIIALAQLVRAHWRTIRIDNPATVIELAAIKMVDTLEQDGSWFVARGHLIVTLAMADFDRIAVQFGLGEVTDELVDAYMEVIRRFSARMLFTGRPFVTIEADKRQRVGTCQVRVVPDLDEQVQFRESAGERGGRSTQTQQQFQEPKRPNILPPTVRESGVSSTQPDPPTVRRAPSRPSTPHQPPSGWSAIPTRKKGPSPSTLPTVTPKWMSVPTVKTMSPTWIELVTGRTVLRTTGENVTVGRSMTADLQVSDNPQVSRLHGNLAFNDGVWWVAAYNPSNPCLVNGMAYTGWRQLRDGDRITWGDFAGAPVSHVRYPTHQLQHSGKRSFV